jgi:hypothetical protein
MDAPFAERIDVASATVTYTGYAPVGTLNASAGWAIQRVTVSGDVTTIEWADGNANADNVWDNRAALSYS